MKKRTIIFLMCLFTLGTFSVAAQPEEESSIKREKIIAVKPKVALKGAVAHTLGDKQYHKIILTISNRDKFPAKMFELAKNEKLPPNPCGARIKTRVVLSVFGEDGKRIAGCLPISSRQALEMPAFFIEKGKTVPQFVYVVLTDLKTDKAYKSNLVSPFGGETK